MSNKKDQLYVNGKWLTYEEFGRIVENKRKEQNMTQYDLGKLLCESEGRAMSEGSCRNTISRIEQGLGKTSTARIALLCKILGIDNNELGMDVRPEFIKLAVRMLEEFEEESKIPIEQYSMSEESLESYYRIFKSVLGIRYMQEVFNIKDSDNFAVHIYNNITPKDIEGKPCCTWAKVPSEPEKERSRISDEKLEECGVKAESGSYAKSLNIDSSDKASVALNRKEEFRKLLEQYEPVGSNDDVPADDTLPSSISKITPEQKQRAEEVFESYIPKQPDDMF